MDDKIYVADGEYGKRGYLKENFKIFNICDRCDEKFDFHYHDFHKLVFFLSGEVKYIIEGKEYALLPNDILIVPSGEIHKPIINPEVEYSRIILWIDKAFLADLSLCFSTARTSRNYLVRENTRALFGIVAQLAEESEDAFASSVMKQSLFNQLMVLLNRITLSGIEERAEDGRINKIIKYINENLCDDLSIDRLSNEFFISKYYLMHRFKEATGKTLHSYIQTKRLLNALDLLESGASAKGACFETGFKDYSVFLKAFKKEFSSTPAAYFKGTKSE